MKQITWHITAWDDYLYWQQENPKIVVRINELIKDTRRDGRKGIGKPERLTQNLSGYWSRRITDEHRLVYTFSGDTITIAACRFHYRR